MGSSMAPLMFNLYLDIMFYDFKTRNHQNIMDSVVAYADDIVLILPKNSYKKTLNAFERHLKIYNLKINWSKSAIIFNFKASNTDYNFASHKGLLATTKIRYLGKELRLNTQQGKFVPDEQQMFELVKRKVIHSKYFTAKMMNVITNAGYLGHVRYLLVAGFDDYNMIDNIFINIHETFKNSYKDYNFFNVFLNIGNFLNYYITNDRFIQLINAQKNFNQGQPAIKLFNSIR